MSGSLEASMDKMPTYRRLEPDKIIATIDSLQQRIAANLGERGLTRICRELATVARDAKRRVIRLRRPNWWLRLVPVMATALFAYLTWVMTHNIDELLTNFDQETASEFKKLFEALKQLKREIALPVALTVPLPLVVGMFVFIWTLVPNI
jgi:hypothetical protein